MVDCNTCKHNFVCKYKEEYIRVKDKSNSEEFKGIFDICCNEYIGSTEKIGQVEILDPIKLKEQIDYKMEAEAYIECELRKIKGINLDPDSLIKAHNFLNRQYKQKETQ
ncbi:MAG: hypothetical protein ACRCX8_05100 [Sarcina sp.]